MHLDDLQFPLVVSTLFCSLNMFYNKWSATTPKKAKQFFLVWTFYFCLKSWISGNVVSYFLIFGTLNNNWNGKNQAGYTTNRKYKNYVFGVLHFKNTIFTCWKCFVEAFSPQVLETLEAKSWQVELFSW